MPASAIASFTAPATLEIIARKPISSGRIGSLMAKPTLRRGSSVCTVLSSGRVAKIVAWGLITPSVPPDQTIGICRTSSIERDRSEEHTSELQSRFDLVCRLLLEKNKKQRSDARKE